MTNDLLPPPAAVPPSVPLPSAPAGSPRRSAGVGRRIVVGLLSTLAGLTVVWGVVTLVDLAAYREITDTFEVAPAPVLVVETDGDVEVVAGRADAPVVLTRTIRRGLRGPTAVERTWSRNDREFSPVIEPDSDGNWTGVVLQGDCPSVVSIRCAVDYRVTVPPGTTVVVRSNAGAVRISGIEGGVDASSTAGSVLVRDIAGRVVLASDAGYVRGEGLRSAEVDARSSAGSVRLFFETAPDTVDAESGAGRVEVVVPDDGAVYDVDATTDAGSNVVAIATDPESVRSIRAHADAGDVLVRHP